MRTLVTISFVIFQMILWVTITESTTERNADRVVAAIPPRQMTLEVDKIVPVKPMPQGITEESMALVMPTNMEPTSSSQEVQAQIVDHNWKNLTQGKFVRNSEFIKAATKVQEAMKPAVSFGEPGGIQHKFEVEMQPAQQVAQLKYSGFVNSEMKYISKENDVEVSVYEKLSDTTKVTLEHKSHDDLSVLKLNYDW